MNTATDQQWNEAYDRLVLYMRTFDLGNHAYVSRLVLDIFQRAKDIYRTDTTREPTALTLSLAQKNITDWLSANLPQPDSSPSHVLPSGYIAILLSRAYRTAPDSFLASPVPEELRQALQETLIVTGPDLNVSSMTPRHLDYGPMLQFARQTWHRVEPKEFFIAVAFWGAVYTVFYWWLSQSL